MKKRKCSSDLESSPVSPKKLKENEKNSESEFENEEEEEEIYEGELKDSIYNGKGILKFPKSGVRFEGEFKDGEKNGYGCFYFKDLENDEEEKLEGNFVDGNLEGKGIYTFSDGTYLVGTYKEGELVGIAEEFDIHGTLLFQGEFQNNLKHGKGVLNYLNNSGKIEGTWNYGVLEGQCIYYYPDRCKLIGTWKDGEMESARFYYSDGQEDQNKFTYFFDPSTKKCISSSPLIQDLYEQQYVYVAKSSIAGEGLFAKQDIKSGQIVSFYNGVRIPHKISDKRKWNQNCNTISLDEEFAIDVPRPFDKVKNYCASLGHKANHSWENNAIYDIYFHPRFSHIKCIRAIKDIPKDCEITVLYGYKENTGPSWYRRSIKKLSNKKETKWTNNKN